MSDLRVWNAINVLVDLAERIGIIAPTDLDEWAANLWIQVDAQMAQRGFAPSLAGLMLQDALVRYRCRAETSLTWSGSRAEWLCNRLQESIDVQPLPTAVGPTGDHGSGQCHAVRRRQPGTR